MTVLRWFAMKYFWLQPRAIPKPPEDHRLDEIAAKLDTVERRLEFLIRSEERAAERAVINHKTLEAKIMAQSEAVQRLVREVSETRGQVASMVAFVKGVPELIRQAVEKALADNPRLSADDLEAVTSMADEMDADQAVILAALRENNEGGEQPAEEPSNPSEPVIG